MPELPEVETIVTDLGPLVEGKSIRSVHFVQPGCISGDCHRLIDVLQGNTITRLFRRGKYICFRLACGAHVTVHLRMTGKLLHHLGEKDSKYLRAYFELEGGGKLFFVDVRKFGRFRLWPPSAPLLPGLGPEPLDAETVADVLGARVTIRPIKTLLLDQRVLAGVGNIYADEALFRARIHPLARPGEVEKTAMVELGRSVSEILKEAVKNKGTTISDYRTPDAGTGGHQGFLKVYGRTGLPCTNCGTVIERIKVNGRGTHFCPRCQPRENGGR